MNAYDSARFHDLMEKLSNGIELSPNETASYNRLDAVARKEWENEKPSFQYGGDMEDVF